MAYDAKRYRTRTTILARPAVLHARHTLSSIVNELKDDNISNPFCKRLDIATRPPNGFPTSHCRSEVDFRGIPAARADKSYHSMSKYYDIRRNPFQQNINKPTNPSLSQRAIQNGAPLNKRLFVRGVSVSNAQPPPNNLMATPTGEVRVNKSLPIPDSKSTFHRVRPSPGYPDMSCYRIVRHTGESAINPTYVKALRKTTNGQEDVMFVRNIRQLLAGTKRVEEYHQPFNAIPVKGILKSSSHSTFQGEDGAISNSPIRSNSPTSIRSQKKVQFKNDVVPNNSFEDSVGSMLNKTVRDFQFHISYNLNETYECADGKSLVSHDNSESKGNGDDKNFENNTFQSRETTHPGKESEKGQYFHKEIVHCIQPGDHEDKKHPVDINENLFHEDDRSQREGLLPPCELHTSQPQSLTVGPKPDKELQHDSPDNMFKIDKEDVVIATHSELVAVAPNQSHTETEKDREKMCTLDSTLISPTADKFQELCAENQNQTNSTVTEYKPEPEVEEYQVEDNATEPSKLEKFTHKDTTTDKFITKDRGYGEGNETAPRRCSLQNLPLLTEKRRTLELRPSSPRAHTIRCPEKTWRILQWLREVESCLNKEQQHDLARSKFVNLKSQRI